MTPFVLFLFPVLLLIIVVVSFVVCIFMIAKAHGNVKNMQKGQKRIFLFFALLPVILVALSITMMVTSNNKSKQELKDDIASGAVKIYEVSDVTNPADTETQIFPLSENVPELSFAIYSENLYTELEKGDIRIRTNEFADVPQVRNNDIGFIRLNSALFDVDESIALLESENEKYTRQDVAIGTVIEKEEEKSSDSGRFMYQLYFKDIDSVLLISVSYTSVDDSRVRYAPVIDREYAEGLYELIISSLNLKIATSTSS